MEMNKFTPKQEAWIKALESDEYEQCINVLHIQDDGYCCLGVALDVLGIEPQMYVEDEDLDVMCALFPSGDERSRADTKALSAEQADALMLASGTGSVKKNYLSDGFPYCSLAEANDEGVSFKDIARWLKNQPHLFFTNFEVPGHEN